MNWASDYSEETVNAAWRSVNGRAAGQTLVDYVSFLDLVVDGHLATVEMAEFEALMPENTCQLDPTDEDAALAMAESARLGTLLPQQPVIVGRFQDRYVILTGNTRYRAAMHAKSNIRYLCIDFNERSSCSTCWMM